MPRRGLVLLIGISLLIHAAVFWPEPSSLQKESARQSQMFSVTLKPSPRQRMADGVIAKQSGMVTQAETERPSASSFAKDVPPKKNNLRRDGHSRLARAPELVITPTQTPLPAKLSVPSNEGDTQQNEVVSIGGYKLALAAEAVRIHLGSKGHERHAGVAIIEVRIGGAVRGAFVVLARSSGEQGMDEQALDLVRRAVAVVPLPSSVSGATIELPVEFGADEAG